jgi:glycerol uptake facilitator-like aquaporin
MLPGLQTARVGIILKIGHEASQLSERAKQMALGACVAGFAVTCLSCKGWALSDAREHRRHWYLDI